MISVFDLVPGENTCINARFLYQVVLRKSMSRHANCDDRTIVQFYDGILPSNDELFRAYARNRGKPLPLRDLPTDPDERQAWLLTARAQHIAAQRGYDFGKLGPLESWVLSPTAKNEGHFKEWFEGKPEGYRLMVHRCGRFERDHVLMGYPPYGCFAQTYRRLRLQGRRPGRVGPDLSGPVSEFLMHVLNAYAHDPSSVHEVFRRTGHRIVRSTGPARGDSK